MSYQYDKYLNPDENLENLKDAVIQSIESGKEGSLSSDTVKGLEKFDTALDRLLNSDNINKKVVEQRIDEYNKLVETKEENPATPDTVEEVVENSDSIKKESNENIFEEDEVNQEDDSESNVNNNGFMPDENVNEISIGEGFEDDAKIAAEKISAEMNVDEQIKEQIVDCYNKEINNAQEYNKEQIFNEIITTVEDAKSWGSTLDLISKENPDTSLTPRGQEIRDICDHYIKIENIRLDIADKKNEIEHNNRDIKTYDELMKKETNKIWRIEIKDGVEQYTNTIDDIKNSTQLLENKKAEIVEKNKEINSEIKELEKELSAEKQKLTDLGLSKTELESKYNENGFDVDGYNRHGYDENGFDVDGYNSRGYDKNGFDVDGYNSRGYDKNGFDVDGFNRYGYDKNGFDVDGYDRYGFDKNGFNEDGYDKKGYDKDRLNKDGYDRYGYDRDGYNKDGYDRKGFDKEGFNKDGYDKEGFNKVGLNQYGINKDGIITIDGKTIDTKFKPDLVANDFFDAFKHMRNTVRAYNAGVAVNDKIPRGMDVTVSVIRFLKSNPLDAIIIRGIGFLLDAISGKGRDKDYIETTGVDKDDKPPRGGGGGGTSALPLESDNKDNINKDGNEKTTITEKDVDVNIQDTTIREVNKNGETVEYKTHTPEEIDKLVSDIESENKTVDVDDKDVTTRVDALVDDIVKEQPSMDTDEVKHTQEEIDKLVSDIENEYKNDDSREENEKSVDHNEKKFETNPENNSTEIKEKENKDVEKKEPDSSTTEEKKPDVEKPDNKSVEIPDNKKIEADENNPVETDQQSITDETSEQAMEAAETISTEEAQQEAISETTETATTTEETEQQGKVENDAAVLEEADTETDTGTDINKDTEVVGDDENNVENEDFKNVGSDEQGGTDSLKEADADVVAEEEEKILEKVNKLIGEDSKSENDDVDSSKMTDEEADEKMRHIDDVVSSVEDEAGQQLADDVSEAIKDATEAMSDNQDNNDNDDKKGSPFLKDFNNKIDKIKDTIDKIKEVASDPEHATEKIKDYIFDGIKDSMRNVLDGPINEIQNYLDIIDYFCDKLGIDTPEILDKMSEALEAIKPSELIGNAIETLKDKLSEMLDRFSGDMPTVEPSNPTTVDTPEDITCSDKGAFDADGNAVEGFDGNSANQATNDINAETDPATTNEMNEGLVDQQELQNDFELQDNSGIENETDAIENTTPESATDVGEAIQDGAVDVPAGVEDGLTDAVTEAVETEGAEIAEEIIAAIL